MFWRAWAACYLAATRKLGFGSFILLLRKERGRSAKFFPSAFQRLGEGASLADDWHEIGVAIPARNDVAVQMRNAPTRDRFAQIKTDVKAIGVECGAENTFGEGNGLHQVGAFLGLHIFQVHQLPEGNSEQMTRIVGKTIEHEVTQPGSMDDQGGPIIAESGKVGEGSGSFGQARGLDIFHAPVRVKLLHSSTSMKQGGLSSRPFLTPS